MFYFNIVWYSTDFKLSVPRKTFDLKVILKIKTSKSNVPIWRWFHQTWEKGRKSNFKNWWSTWVTQRNKSVKFSQNELFIQTMFYNHITRQTEPSIQELNKTVFFYLSLSTRSEETEISKKDYFAKYRFFSGNFLSET